jgi:hypothetical protein
MHELFVVHSEQRNNVAASSGSSPQDHWKTQVAWEESHMGNYHCIYPCLGYNRYEQFFHQNQGSLFQDTAASRAREEYGRMQREELEVFIKYFVLPSVELMPQCKYVSFSGHILCFM